MSIGTIYMSSEQRGSLYAILSGFLYGFIGYFGLNAIHAHLSPSTMLFWRFFISSVAVSFMVIPHLNEIKKEYKAMGAAFLSGALGYGVSTWLYFLGSQYIGSGLTMVIFFTYPVMIMLINYFVYRQSIPAVYYWATFVILIGMILLVDMKSLGFNLTGIAFSLASAFFYACYIVASKRNKIPPNWSTLMVCLGCMTTTLIISCGEHSLVIPSTMTTWANLLGIGLLSTVMPVLLMLYSLKYISSEKASLLSVLEPVFVVIFGVLLLGERISGWNAVGIILVLLGASVTLFSHKFSLEKIVAVAPRLRNSALRFLSPNG